MAYGYLTETTWLRNVVHRSRAATGSMVFDAERRTKGTPRDSEDSPGMTPSRDIHRIG